VKILFNANIHTMDPKRPTVSALLIDQGRVLASGSDQEIFSLAAPQTEKEDLNGKTVWPGLTDAHMHLEAYALSLKFVNCETETLEKCLQLVAERARQTPAGSWIEGWGWNQNVWKNGFPTAADLDRVAPHHLVSLQAKSGHAMWLNSLALQKANINANTPDPAGGLIQRDSKNQPTGILFENAIELISSVTPEPDENELVNLFLDAQTSLWKMGVTGLHDMDQRRSFVTLQKLNKEGKLALRVIKSIPEQNFHQAVAVGLRTGFGDDFLRIGSLKLFADGALGPQTAAMLHPYEGSKDDVGILLLDAEQVFEYGQEASRNGISLAIHAIGDRANHEVLDGYAHLREFEKQNQLPFLRHRIEHVQLLHEKDIQRMSSLQVIASMQPLHATSDMIISDHHWGNRSITAYAWETLRQNGACLAFGSDAPVEIPNPFYGLHAAVTRRRTDGTPGPEGWYPQLRMSLQTALEGYTIGAAYAGGVEDRLGRLAPGYLADLILLDHDPFTMPPQDLFKIQPSATMVAGRWVYRV
jgi:predicted amidohydrolase YtcJ